MIEKMNDKIEEFYLGKLEQELKDIGLALAKGTKMEVGDIGDDAAEVQETRDQQEQIVNNYRERQREVERALKWTRENGGICAICRESIEISRRDADPASITCIKHRDKEDSIEI